MDRLAFICAQPALIAAILANPYLAVRHLAPRADLQLTLAVSGLVSLFIHVAVPVALHLLDVPISIRSLALVHVSLTLCLLVLTRLRRLSCHVESSCDARVPIMLCALFALLVLPFTHLAGIDTYKWQGLATNVRVEQAANWLVHPLSLAGFTPRAYPCIQPLLLATVQVLGRYGVDWGFYVVSVLIGTLGIMSAWVFGRRCFGTPQAAHWFSFLYAFSPVFMRYGHWATGRGALLAVLPLFLLGVLELPRRRGWALLAVTALLLPATHKTGTVALLVMLPLAAVSPLVPGRRWTMVLVAAPFMLAAVVFAEPRGLSAPAGSVVGFLLTDVTRFGWMLLPLVVGLLLSDALTRRPAMRCMPILLATFPIAHARDMYGALLALPVVTMAATAGLLELRSRTNRWAYGVALAAVSLTLLGSVAIVVNRSFGATPERIRQAAAFLEGHDPHGPFTLDAPGRTRQQMHAYVSGCPRFTIHHAGPPTLRLLAPPAIKGPPRDVLLSWMTYLRDPFELSGIEMEWYGTNPKAYFVTVDGEGTHPEGAERLYEQDGVCVLAMPQDGPSRR